MIIFFIRLALGAVIAMPFYLILRRLYLWRTKAHNSILREILLCAFVLFMSGLVLLVLWPENLAGQTQGVFWQAAERLRTGTKINLIPLRSIRSYFTGRIGRPFVINIIANILMFSPMGMCLPLFWQRFQKWQPMLVTGILFPAGIETAQLFVGRAVDIDDVILNAAGVMLGYAAYRSLAYFKAKYSNTSRGISDSDS